MSICFQCAKRASWRPLLRFRKVTPNRRYSAEAQGQSAESYCLELLRKYDSPSYVLLAFVPPPSRAAYLAVRAFNIEVARVADTVSTPEVGALRMQFWRDIVSKALAGAPPQHPVALQLAKAQETLAQRASLKLTAAWLNRMISAREKYLGNSPFTSMAELESYAESAYSTQLYLTLQSIPMASVTADHLASHIGKAAGIAAVLRGLPLLAFPPPPNHHSSNEGLAVGVQAQRQRSQQGIVCLPLDVMSETGLKEEDVFRKGPEAEGLRDAVFKVATRASDHLITAQTMLENLKRGEDVGHEFEHANEEEHSHAKHQAAEGPLADVNQAFGVFMPAVSTRQWLSRLEDLDFDIFSEKLRRRDWKLPWVAYMAFKRKRL